MLEKLRSRHPIDVPAEGWKRSYGLLAALGGLLALFVLLPLGLSGFAAVRTLDALYGVAAGVGALVLVLMVLAARGKSGHARR